MKLLQDRILKEGTVIGTEILKVDGFMNHQMDPAFLNELADEFCRLFGDLSINRILTIESSGIAVAVLTGLKLKVPVVYAKKSQSSNIGEDVYSSRIHSFTRGTDCDITVSKKYLKEGDRVLILDDFLANGEALTGLTDLCRQAGAVVEGIGICIEKGFQPGGRMIREKGYRVESLAIVEFMGNGCITFRE
ncbi:MAG: xanthine phosphoribosyltransferase [Lachnospiraceae bacterium]|nr:xanthine phosphoribosyltransferase [Lachnospiraceae bacterium]